MTEGEWRSSTDPSAMLVLLRGKVSDRKLRLFAAACGRSVEPVPSYPYCRDAVAVAEAFADGLVPADELSAIHERLRLDGVESRYPMGEAADASVLAFFVSYLVGGEADAQVSAQGAASFAPKVAARRTPYLTARAKTAEHVRCVFRHPSRQATSDPSWLTPTVVALAQAVYAEWAFDRLPILADALEEAGCDDQDLLNHCRFDGIHVRGCWVVDSILGKV